jgi:hypothetical protein
VGEVCQVELTFKMGWEGAAPLQMGLKIPRTSSLSLLSYISPSWQAPFLEELCQCPCPSRKAGSLLGMFGTEEKDIILEFQEVRRERALPEPQWGPKKQDRMGAI